MSYISAKMGTNLSPNEFITEMNKAIKFCDGYLDGMTVTNTGAGYELLVNGDLVHHSEYEHILMRAERLVMGLNQSD